MSSSLRLGLGQSLGHAERKLARIHNQTHEGQDLQVKEGELAGAAAIFVHEATSEVTPEDGSEVALRDLID